MRSNRPLLALSALAFVVKARDDQRLQLADLSGLGSVKQDTEAIYTMHALRNAAFTLFVHSRSTKHMNVAVINRGRGGQAIPEMYAAVCQLEDPADEAD